MLTFWIVAALLIVAALAFVLVPLLRPRARSGPTVREANLAVLRGQRQEIEADVTHGPAADGGARVGPRGARRARRGRPRRRRRAAGARPSAPPLGGGRRSSRCSFPAVAVAFYLWVGTPHGDRPEGDRRRRRRRAGRPPDRGDGRGPRAEDEGAARRRAGLGAAGALLRRHRQGGQGARGLRAPREDRAARTRRCSPTTPTRSRSRAGATSRASPPSW